MDVNFARKPIILRFIREKRRLIFALVLPVYLFIVQASITNRHTHFYANGMVVTHSHPFDHHGKSADKHSHSQKEICFYTALYCDLYQSEPDTLMPGFYGFNLLTSCSRQIVFLQDEISGQLWLRGPPVSFAC